MVQAQVSIKIVIMAHPKRRARAESLREAVGGGVIVFDHGAGEWATGEAAWREGALWDASHVLVLQDDAEPAEGFVPALHRAVTSVPDSPISLYLGRVKPTRWAQNVSMAVGEAVATDAHWIRASHLLHGVGIVLPRKWITPMLDYCEMFPNVAYDQRIGQYLRRMRNKSTFYTWPSLVDHADVPSLVRHNDDHRIGTDGRVAYRVGASISYAPIVVECQTPEGAEL
jgi:hypothetical protein